MRIKFKDIIKLGYILFLISSIFIESSISDISGMSVTLRIIKYLGIVLCIIPGYSSAKMKKGKMYIYVLLIALSFVNMLMIDGGSGLLEIIIVTSSIGFSNIDIKKIFKISIYTLLLGHMAVICLCQIGVIPDIVSSRWFGSYMGSLAGENIRHQMGFRASNQIPLTLLIIYLMLIAYKQEKIKLIEHSIFLIANFFCFFYFGARVSLVLIIAVFISYELIVKANKLHFKKRNKHTKPIIWITFWACSFLSLITATLYNANSKYWFLANEIFYNRLKWSNAAMNKYGFSILGYGSTAGQATGVYGENLVDNGYVLILIHYGIVISAIILALWSFITYWEEKRGDKLTCLSLVTIAIASLIDNHLVSYKMIPFFCLFFTIQSVVKTSKSKKNMEV